MDCPYRRPPFFVNGLGLAQAPLDIDLAPGARNVVGSRQDLSAWLALLKFLQVTAIPRRIGH
jgi:hypothetical protein